MRTQRFSKRVSLYFMVATAILIVGVFTTVYLVVYKTVYNHLDSNLNAEYQEVSSSIVALSDDIIFTNQGEWTEAEHGQVEVNPTFIQVTDTMGNVLKKSSNLGETSLTVFKNENRKVYLNASLTNEKIRLIQVELSNTLDKKIGYISVAVPLNDTQMVLRNLRVVLFILFPLVLVVLYFTTKLIAQKSIEPVILLSENTDKITRKNLDQRIPLPVIHDELFNLTENINKLLDRIEEAVKREKQFSSDASHELRTPLSVLKGTLEVMTRKPRNADYYDNKVKTCLEEVDRMTVLVEQLLLLAQYESPVEITNLTQVRPEHLIHQIIVRHIDSANQKEITFHLAINKDISVLTDIFMLEQIIENIIVNAIKYSYSGNKISISLFEKDNKVSLCIKDKGVGMNSNELANIFNRFYRSDVSRNSHIKGYGLGLAIVKRFADLLHINIHVSSTPKQGTEFILTFLDAD